MRYLAHLILLLCLFSTQALANGSQQVELIVFRQGEQSLPASRLAPDSWANHATLVSAEMLRTTHLDHLAKELTPDNGYQLLLHKAWVQNSQDGIAHMAISGGEAHFQHYPVEGTLAFELDRSSTVQLDLWINQFNPDQSLRSSERFKQKAIVINDQVTFIDHSTLGALIRIQSLSNNQAPKASRFNPEDFE